MCDAADVSASDTIVEIGPGTGALTSVLLERGARVIALETDPRALAVLADTYATAITANQLKLIQTDVRTLALDTISDLNDHQFKIVANIPYYLSGLLFRSALQAPVQPSTLVYLVQKEVAKRACANISKGEKGSLLSLALQCYGCVEYVRSVPRGHFTPPPKVDSAIVAVRNIDRLFFAEFSETAFFTLLHLGFAQKRKQLLGNLAVQYERETVSRALSTLGLPPDIRAEDVSLTAWHQLAIQLLSTRT